MSAPMTGVNPGGPGADANARLLYRYGGDPTLAMLSMLRELGYRGGTFMNPYMSSLLGAAPGLQNAFLIQQAMNPGNTPEAGVDLGAASTQAFSDYLRSTLSGGGVMPALAAGRQGLMPALQAAQDYEPLEGGTPNPYLTSLQEAFGSGGGGGALDILSSLANPFMPQQMQRALDTSLKRGLASAMYQYSESPDTYSAEGRSLGNILFPGLAPRAVLPPATSTAAAAPPPTGVTPPSPITGQPSGQSVWGQPIPPEGQVAATMNQALAGAAGPPSATAGAKLGIPGPEQAGMSMGSVFGGGEANPLQRLADMASPTKAQQGVLDLLKEQKRRLGFNQTRG